MPPSVSMTLAQGAGQGRMSLRTTKVSRRGCTVVTPPLNAGRVGCQAVVPPEEGRPRRQFARERRGPVIIFCPGELGSTVVVFVLTAPVGALSRPRRRERRWSLTMPYVSGEFVIGLRSRDRATAGEPRCPVMLPRGVDRPAAISNELPGSMAVQTDITIAADVDRLFE